LSGHSLEAGFRIVSGKNLDADFRNELVHAYASRCGNTPEAVGHVIRQTKGQSCSWQFLQAFGGGHYAQVRVRRLPAL
jgi:hypothetical protein